MQDNNHISVQEVEARKRRLQNEYNYIMAERITKQMLESDLITSDEFHKIMALNRESFQPEYAVLMD